MEVRHVYPGISRPQGKESQNLPLSDKHPKGILAWIHAKGENDLCQAVRVCHNLSCRVSVEISAAGDHLESDIGPRQGVAFMIQDSDDVGFPQL